MRQRKPMVSCSPEKRGAPKWKNPNRTLTNRARQIVRDERRAAGLTKPEILRKAMHEILQKVNTEHPFMEWLTENPERLEQWQTLVLKGVAVDEALLQLYNKANRTNYVRIPAGWIKTKKE